MHIPNKPQLKQNQSNQVNAKNQQARDQPLKKHRIQRQSSKQNLHQSLRKKQRPQMKVNTTSVI